MIKTTIAIARDRFANNLSKGAGVGQKSVKHLQISPSQEGQAESKLIAPDREPFRAGNPEPVTKNNFQVIAPARVSSVRTRSSDSNASAW